MSLFDVEENTLQASIELAKQEIWRIYNEADDQRNKIVSALIDSHMDSINVPREGIAEQAYHILLRESKILDELPPQYQSLKTKTEAQELEINGLQNRVQDLYDHVKYLRNNFSITVK